MPSCCRSDIRRCCGRWRVSRNWRPSSGWGGSRAETAFWRCLAMDILALLRDCVDEPVCRAIHNVERTES